MTVSLMSERIARTGTNIRQTTHWCGLTADADVARAKTRELADVLKRVNLGRMPHHEPFIS